MDKNDVLALREDPAGLEKLFRRAEADSKSADFKRAMAEAYSENPNDLLLSAWACRLDIAPAAEAIKETARPADTRRWLYAVIIGFTLGVVCAGAYNILDSIQTDETPAWLWINWSAVFTVAILAYLASIDRQSGRARRYVYGIIGAVVLSAAASLLFWDLEGDQALLVGLHLPLIMWALIGGSVSLGLPDRARQFYYYAVKSVEIVFAAFIFFAMGTVFIAISLSIFETLGVEIPQRLLNSFAAWGVGFIAVIAVAGVYDAGRTPGEQTWSAGASQILKIGARILLPLSIAVLIAYTAFIPSRFWEPFKNRDLLVVNNLAVLALLVLFAYAVPNPGERIGPYLKRAVRLALLAAGLLTLLLNAYAGAAAVSRTVNYGLTPNRETVIGWNAATLILLVFLAYALIRGKKDDWPDLFGTWFARGLAIVLVWAAFVALILPFQF